MFQDARRDDLIFRQILKSNIFYPPHIELKLITLGISPRQVPQRHLCLQLEPHCRLQIGVSWAAKEAFRVRGGVARHWWGLVMARSAPAKWAHQPSTTFADSYDRNMRNGEKRASWNEFDGTLRLRRKRQRELCFCIALVAACLGLFEADCSPTHSTSGRVLT